MKYKVDYRKADIIVDIICSSFKSSNRVNMGENINLLS